MKKSKCILLILSFIALTAYGQTDLSTSVTGTLTNVRPFNDQYAITVGNTTVVLIKHSCAAKSMKKSTETSFEINQEYKDILVKNKGKYALNPKYSNKKFIITYYMNGKGWKCIKKIERSK